jgi:hypothetical protein
MDTGYWGAFQALKQALIQAPVLALPPNNLW